MKIPKNHVAVSVDIQYDIEGPLEDVITTLKAKAEGICEPVIRLEVWDGYAEVTLHGYRPMTADEKRVVQKAAKARKDARARASALKTEQELQLLAELKAKYEQGS